MLIIGDVHALFSQYESIIYSESFLEGDKAKTLVIGDFGIGFNNPPINVMKMGNHRYFRGNHDNPTMCKEDPFCIKDGTLHEGIFCVGGAYSIDKYRRTEGIDWWHDEELTINEFNNIINDYENIKPDVVATHDCPANVKSYLIKKSFDAGDSRTQQALETMFTIHKPSIWFFGHWHMSFDKIIGGTRFICLNELETMRL